MNRAADLGSTVRIEGFDQLQPIGRGGYSFVFSARQQDFNRRVALKVMTFGLADEREKRNFERECRAMGLVSQHPNIVTVFNSAFTDGGQPVIVMELYSGGTFADEVKRSGPIGVGRVLETGIKLAGALETAHRRGLLHRDIKPQNLFISDFGEPALGDFGISTVDEEVSMSSGGGLTVHYAPPEVLEGAPATSASDVYSLAATLYTLIEGSRPFASTTTGRQAVGELARRIMLEPPARPARADVPRSLSDLLLRAMAKLPSDRPPSAGEFGVGLQRVQNELGLAVTAMPVAPGDTRDDAAPSAPGLEAPPSLSDLFGDDDAGRPPAVVSERPARLAPPAPPRIPAGPDEVDVRVHVVGEEEEEDLHTHTVSQLPGLAEAVEAAPPASRKRVILGTLAGLILLLGLGFVMFITNQREGETVGTTTTALGNGPGLNDPVPPDGLRVVPSTTKENAVDVVWRPVQNAASGVTYQVKRLDTSVETEVPGDTQSLTLDGVAPNANFCVQIRTNLSNGVSSVYSDPQCL